MLSRKNVDTNLVQGIVGPGKIEAKLLIFPDAYDSTV